LFIIILLYDSAYYLAILRDVESFSFTGHRRARAPRPVYIRRCKWVSNFVGEFVTTGGRRENAPLCLWPYCSVLRWILSMDDCKAIIIYNSWL